VSHLALCCRMPVADVLVDVRLQLVGEPQPIPHRDQQEVSVDVDTPVRLLVAVALCATRCCDRLSQPLGLQADRELPEPDVAAPLGAEPVVPELRPDAHRERPVQPLCVDLLHRR
jgi:hypothetical protein